MSVQEVVVTSVRTTNQVTRMDGGLPRAIAVRVSAESSGMEVEWVASPPGPAIGTRFMVTLAEVES